MKTMQREKQEKKTTMKFLPGFVLILSLSATALPLAQAAIAPVGPFSGAISETWESFLNSPPFLPNPTAIFGGGASVSGSRMAVYSPGGLFWGSSGDAQVADGVKGMVIDEFSSTTTISFATAVSSFGGYWGAATVAPDLTGLVMLSFFDAGGGLIGSDSFTYDHSSNSDGVLDWHGWMSTTAIKSLTYGGDFVANDGLQANLVNSIPEPEIYAMMIVGLGVLSFVARRKKKLQELAVA